MIGSDVSLAGYPSTHVALFMFCSGDFGLTSLLGLRRVACTSATILCPWEGLVDSQASQPFSFVVVCTQTCNASACCLYAPNDGSCDPCLYLMLCGSSEPLSI